MASSTDSSAFDKVKEKWTNPLYREGIGRRTGRELLVNANRDSDGFENLSEYFTDSIDSDVSELLDKENDASLAVGKAGETQQKKLSSPLKPMQSFVSSGRSSSEPSSLRTTRASTQSNPPSGNDTEKHVAPTEDESSGYETGEPARDGQKEELTETAADGKSESESEEKEPGSDKESGSDEGSSGSDGEDDSGKDDENLSMSQEESSAEISEEDTQQELESSSKESRKSPVKTADQEQPSTTEDQLPSKNTTSTVTPVQKESLNEADITGSIICGQSSQEPNTALRQFKAKKRLSFTGHDQTVRKNKANKKGTPRKSPHRKKGATNHDEPEDGAQKQAGKEVDDVDELDKDAKDLNDTLTEDGSDTPTKKSSDEEQKRTVKKQPRKSSRLSVKVDAKSTEGQTKEKSADGTPTKQAAQSQKSSKKPTNEDAANEEEQVAEEELQKKADQPSKSIAKNSRRDHIRKSSAFLQESMNDSAEASKFVMLQKSHHQTLVDDVVNDKDDDGDEDDGFRIVEEPSRTQKKKTRKTAVKKATKRKSELQNKQEDQDQRKFVRKTRSHDVANEVEESGDSQAEEGAENERKESDKEIKGKKGRPKKGGKIAPSKQERAGTSEEENNMRVTRNSRRNRRSSAATTKHEKKNDEGDKSEMVSDEVQKRQTRQSRSTKQKSTADEKKGETGKEVGKRKTRNTRENRKRMAEFEVEEISDQEQKGDQDQEETKNKKTRRKGRMERQDEQDVSQDDKTKTRNTRRRNTRQHAGNQGESDEACAGKKTKSSKSSKKKEAVEEEDAEIDRNVDVDDGEGEDPEFPSQDPGESEPNDAGEDNDAEVEEHDDELHAEGKDAPDDAGEDNAEVNEHEDVVDGEGDAADPESQEQESEHFMDVKQRSNKSTIRRSFELVQLAAEIESEISTSQDDNKSTGSADPNSHKPTTRGHAKSKSSSSDENHDRRGRSKLKGASGGEGEQRRVRSKSKSGGSENENKRGHPRKKRSAGTKDNGSKSQSSSGEDNRKRVRSRSKSHSKSKRSSSMDGDKTKNKTKSKSSDKSNDDFSKSSKTKTGQSKRKTSRSSVDDGDPYDFVNGEDVNVDVSHSVVIQPVDTKRLSWQKSPSELSPINPDVFDDPKNNRTKNKKNNANKQKTNKQKGQVDRSRRKRKADTSGAAVSEAGDGSSSEVIAKKVQRSEVVTKQQGQRKRGRRKGKSNSATIEETEVDAQPPEADSVSRDMLESQERDQSTSSERDGEGSNSEELESDDKDRRASCVLQMGKQQTVEVMVHAHIEDSTMDVPPEQGDSSTSKGCTPSMKSTGLTPTPRSVLKRPNSKKHVKSRRLTMKFFEQPKKKGYLIEPEEVNGLRCTKRTRVQTLEYWRNERPLYERRKSGGFALVGVLSPPNGSQTPDLKRKTKPRKKQRNLSVTPSNVSMHVTTPPRAQKVASSSVLVVNPDTDEEVKVDAIVTSKMHQYVGPSGKVADPDDPITICKCLHQPAFSSGLLKIRPFKEKSTQLVKRNTMVFHIIAGKLAVMIHNTTQILQTGDSFFVPQGNVYNIKNLRKDEAKLKFFQLKNA